VRGQVEVSFRYLAVEAYTSVGPRLRLGLLSPIRRPYLQGRIGWQIESLGFVELDPLIDDAAKAELGLEGPYVLGFYEQSITLDLRDDPVEPRWGGYFELRIEEGTPAALGEFEFVRIAPDLRGYVPLGPLVLAARGRVAGIFGDLPVTLRFYSGGASNQRGFPERRLAPVVSGVVDGKPDSVVVGGGGALETGVELRTPLGSAWGLRFGAVAFLDGADVTERLEDLDPSNLHWATGLGLRLYTPVGPVRIDVGYRLNRKGPGELRPGEDFAYHLSLGEAF
jgi:outer membrane translocation and assembly module TamA